MNDETKLLVALGALVTSEAKACPDCDPEPLPSRAVRASQRYGGGRARALLPLNRTREQG